MYIANKLEKHFNEKNEEYNIYSDIKKATFKEFIESVPDAPDINKSEKYYQFFMTGDTETSKVYFDFKDKDLLCPLSTPRAIKDKKLKDYPRVDYVYFWQIDFNGKIGFGRDIREFVEFIQYISKRFEKIYRTTKDGRKYYKKIKLFFFNLGYDFQFFKDYFPNLIIRIGTTTSPVQVSLTNTIELVDAQALVGNRSLKGCLEDYNIFIPKDGLNHDILRTPYTKLNDREIGYCLDDVYYLRKFIESKIEFQKDFYKKIGDLPYTKTQEVTYFMKNIAGTKNANVSLDEANELKGNRLIDVSKEYIKFEDIKYKASYNKKTLFFNNSLIEFRKKKARKLTAFEVANLIVKKRCGKTVGDKYALKAEEEELRKAYCGGFTHANMKYLGSFINQKVHCWDLTSDYTSEMSTQKYVYSYSISVDKIANDTNVYGYLFKATIKNIEAIHPYGLISKHRCEELKGVKEDKNEHEFETITIDNGRVLRADEMVVYGTDVDLENWKKCYKWKSIEFSEIRKGKKYYLHNLITDSIDHFYTKKSEYKGLCKKYEGTDKLAYFETVLKLVKGQLNSMYGLSVMDRIKYVKQNIENLLDRHDYKNEEEFMEDLKNLVKEAIENYYETNKEFENRLFTYAIGVQVTAYARKRIIDVITRIPDDKFLYADTDSIYCIYTEEIENIIKEYNIGMQNDINNYVKRKHIEDQAEIWKTNDKMPSQYASEGSVDGFCTMGAKRYVKYKDGKFKVTVAGANKKNASEKLNSFGSISKALNYFRQGMFLSEEESGKKLHAYSSKEAIIHKYSLSMNNRSNFFTINVDECEIECSSWVSLYPIQFKSSYSETVKTCVRMVFGKDLALGYHIPNEVLDNFNYFDYVKE